MRKVSYSPNPIPTSLNSLSSLTISGTYPIGVASIGSWSSSSFSTFTKFYPKRKLASSRWDQGRKKNSQKFALKISYHKKTLQFPNQSYKILRNRFKVLLDITIFFLDFVPTKIVFCIVIFVIVLLDKVRVLLEHLVGIIRMILHQFSDRVQQMLVKIIPLLVLNCLKLFLNFHLSLSLYFFLSFKNRLRPNISEFEKTKGNIKFWFYFAFMFIFNFPIFFMPIEIKSKNNTKITKEKNRDLNIEWSNSKYNST